MSGGRYDTEVFGSREEWLKNRGIGGSSAAAIVGLSPWMTDLELFNSFFYESKEKADNETLAYGRAMEPIIRELWAATHPNHKMQAPNGYEQYRRKDIPLLTATVDGIVYDPDGRKGVWECKTHQIRNAEDAENWNGGWPINYVIQVLHYLLVLSDCDFVELTAQLDFYDYTDGGKRLKRSEIRYEHIERADVENELKWLEEEEFKFAKAIELGIPPNGEIKF